MIQFLEGLFPLLSVNCLLGLRRACRRTKCLSEDYLQSGPRSRNQICLNVGPESVEMPGRKSLKKFLQEDNVCSIRNPSSHFQLAYTDPDVLGIPRVFTFLQKYAKHVVHLKIFHLTLPLTEHEMMFFVKLENLRSLKVTWLIGREHDESVRKIPFPESFKNLKSLKIDQWGDTLGPGSCSTLRKGDLLLQLVQHCKKLVYFRDPNRLPGVERFMIMSKILDDGEHKKLQFYDMMQHKPDFVDNIQREVSVHDLCRRSIAAKLKWSHAPPLLLASLERGQLEQMAPHVVSLMKGWNGRYHIMLEDIQFPQLEQLYFSLVDEVPESIRSHWISKIFSPSVFPNLKKLTVDLTAGAESVSEVLVLIWNTLPNLEEVSLCQESPGLLRDDAFIGLNGERPFLQLTSTLKLRVVKTHDYHKLISLFPQTCKFVKNVYLF